MENTRIQHIRKELGLTVAEFAELLQVNFKTLEGWLGGSRNPYGYHLDLLLKLEASIKDEHKKREIIKNLAKLGGWIGLLLLIVKLDKERKNGD